MELWNSPTAQDVRFESLAPGEVYESMFCMAPGWADRGPVTATVRYRSGGLLPRLMDVDDEHHGWRMLGRVTSWLSRGRVPRRKSFVLDPKGLFAMRYNVGFAGKEELGAIVKELERGRRERGPAYPDPSADVGSPADGDSRELTEPVVSSVIRTEAVTDRRVQRRTVGAPADPLGAYDRPAALRTISCRMELPGNARPGAIFHTPDLEDLSEGGYEISRDGRLSFVSPVAWGGRLPDTSQCGPVLITRCLRFHTRPPDEVHKFVVELRDGQVVSGPSVDED